MPLSSTENFEVITSADAKERCLFTTRAFKSGESIYQMDYWSKEVMPMHVTNHSCEPNARFDESGMLVALQDIPSGVEITFDYLNTPTPASPWNFACQCGTASCIGWVKAASSNDAMAK
jgi:SET domain